MALPLDKLRMASTSVASSLLSSLVACRATNGGLAPAAPSGGCERLSLLDTVVLALPHARDLRKAL